MTGPRYEILSDDVMDVLHIPHVTADDAGKFTVITSNSLGTASHSATLSVDLTASNRRQQDLDHGLVNGFSQPTALMQQRAPASRHSPRSSKTEHAVSPTHLQMTPGCLVTLL